LRLVGGHGYFASMAARRTHPEGFVEPCIPTLAAKPPSGPDWVHEIKHDGYRLIVRRDGDAVRLFTRRGHDWTERYPAVGWGLLFGRLCWPPTIVKQLDGPDVDQGQFGNAGATVMGSTADKVSGLANEVIGKASRPLETRSDRTSSKRRAPLKS
jgi:ATP dependent DNA ligase domain